MRLFSPAKINLYLKVMNKREDGFHNIASLMQTINLCDELEIEFCEQDTFTCDDQSLPLDSANLVLRALELFRQKSGKADPINIKLKKKIPIQAGLGGGSSNAATTLWGLNSLYKNEFSENTIRDWAKDLGSDVPFFFSTGTAFCQGRGEQVENLQPLPIEKITIVKPKEGLSSAEVYSTVKPSTNEDMTCFTNDLEEPVFSLKPQLRQLKQDLLDAGYFHVFISGSGTSFICLGHGEYVKTPNVSIYPVQYTSRKESFWYS